METNSNPSLTLLSTPMSPQLLQLKRSASKRQGDLRQSFQIKIQEISPKRGSINHGIEGNGMRSKRARQSQSPLLNGKKGDIGLRVDTKHQSQGGVPQNGNNKAFGQIFSYFIKRNDFKNTNFFNLKQFRSEQDMAKTEKDEIKERLQSVKNHGMIFENMPTITYDDEESGWKCIYLGILSPYGNKYEKYVEKAITKAKEESNSLGLNNSTQGSSVEEKFAFGMRRSITNNNIGTSQGPQTMKSSSSQPLVKGFSTQIQSQLKQSSNKRTLEEKKSSNSLLKSNSQKNIYDADISQAEKDLYKLSEFKKFMLVNELINGKISRSSAEYMNQLFKKGEGDYMKVLYKKILIRKALKNNFEEPYMINGRKKIELSIPDELISPTRRSQHMSNKTVEMIHNIQKNIQRAGLDPKAPHFSLDMDKFTYVDFESIISPLIQDDDNFEDDFELGNKERIQEKRNFIDAHYLNRRKSCQCKCCGGTDNEGIRKMDKTAMDQLKLGISHLLNQKINTNTNIFLRRMKMGKIDENDDVISKNLGPGKRKRKINILPLPASSPLLKPIQNKRSSQNIFDSLKKMKMRNTLTANAKQQEDFATIITIDELNKFGGISQPITAEPSPNPGAFGKTKQEIIVSNFLSKMAQEDGEYRHEDSDNSDVQISIVTSSLQTSFDSQDMEENEKQRLEFIASKNIENEKQEKILNIKTKKRVDKMRILFKPTDNFKIKQYKLLSESNPTNATLNENITVNLHDLKKQRKSMDQKGQATKLELANMFLKLKSKIIKHEVKDELSKFVKTQKDIKVKSQKRLIYSASPKQQRPRLAILLLLQNLEMNCHQVNQTSIEQPQLQRSQLIITLDKISKFY
eukprot:403367551